MNSQSLLLVADRDQLFELEAVGADHPHRHDLKDVDRIRDPLGLRRDGLPVAVGQEDRHLAFVEREQGRDVKARFSFAVIAVVPGTELETTPVMAGAEEQDITLPQPDALGLLGGFELFGRDGLARLQPGTRAGVGYRGARRGPRFRVRRR